MVHSDSRQRRDDESEPSDRPAASITFASDEAKINDAVGNAGGCTEAWEGMAELRNDEPQTRQPRRQFMQTAAAASVGLVGLGAAPLAASAEGPPEVDVGSANPRKALGKALSDENTRDIMHAFLENGWTPRFGDAEAGLTEADGESWYTVLLPFDDGDPTQDEQTYILWSKNPNFRKRATGHHTVHRDPADAEAYWDVTEYWVEDGDVVSETHEILNFLGCSNVNWGCVLVTAGEFVGTIGGCYACAQTAGILVPACAACISGVLASSGTVLLCDYCRD